MRVAGLGDDSVFGPLDTFDVPSFAVDPNLLIAGAALLAGVFLINNLGGRVRRRVSSYRSARRRRKVARRKIREEYREAMRKVR